MSDRSVLVPGRSHVRVHPAGLVTFVGLVVLARVPALSPGRPGFALVALAAAALVFDGLWASLTFGRSVELTVSAPAVGRVGDEIVISVVMKNRPALLALRLQDSELGADGSAPRGGIGPSRAYRLRVPCEVKVTVVAERRGRVASIDATLSAHGPLGLIGKSSTVSAPLSRPLLVGPSPEAPPPFACWPPLVAHRAVEEPGVTALSRDGDELLRGVRPYEAGDSLRRVHWPQTARTARVMVREHDATTDPQRSVVVVADLREDPEPVAARAAGVVLALLSSGWRPVLISWREGAVRIDEPISADELSAALALAESGPPTPESFVASTPSAGASAAPGTDPGAGGRSPSAGAALRGFVRLPGSVAVTVVDAQGWRSLDAVGGWP